MTLLLVLSAAAVLLVAAEAVLSRLWERAAAHRRHNRLVEVDRWRNDLGALARTVQTPGTAGRPAPQPPLEGESARRPGTTP